MHIESKPKLALLIGTLFLLLTMSVQNPSRCLPLTASVVSREGINHEELQPHGNASSMRGLYGYRYHGF
jgi:hypothetical protein